MSTTTRATPRRPRTELDRSVDERAARRRRALIFRRRIRVTVSEADVAVWFLGMLSLIYCSVTIVVEVLRLLAG